MISTLTSKGQITVPKPIRERLDLQPGDRVEFFIDESGEITLVPVTRSITKLKGLVPRPDKPVTLEEMQHAIEKRGDSE
jgi:AbrB family looped-hinge helix DNA binding protein